MNFPNESEAFFDRQMDPSSCFGIQDTLCHDPMSVASSTNSGPGGAVGRTDERGNSVSHVQGGSFQSTSLPTAVRLNPFCWRGDQTQGNFVL